MFVQLDYYLCFFLLGWNHQTRQTNTPRSLKKTPQIFYLRNLLGRAFKAFHPWSHWELLTPCDVSQKVPTDSWNIPQVLYPQILQYERNSESWTRVWGSLEFFWFFQGIVTWHHVNHWKRSVLLIAAWCWTPLSTTIVCLNHWTRFFSRDLNLWINFERHLDGPYFQPAGNLGWHAHHTKQDQDYKVVACVRDVFEDQTPDGPNRGEEQFSGPFKQPPGPEKETTEPSWERSHILPFQIDDFSGFP